MQKIFCDYCNKEITDNKPCLEPGMYEDRFLELCDDCDNKYESIRRQLIEYRKEVMKEAENKVKEKQIELFKEMGVIKDEKESI